MTYSETPHTPAISVLVPVYNVERYLRQCLDSLKAQTFSDFEVICLNDGSTDGSPAILHEYAGEDPRFRVIDKSNSGYGASMNRGLDEARGTYIAILESDDFFEPSALETLYTTAENERVPLVKADFWFYWSTPTERRERGAVIDNATAGVYCPANQPEIFYRKPSIWSAIYLRTFLEEHNIRFLETPGAAYQDTSFSFKTLALAKRAAFINEPVLSYRQDNESSSVNSSAKAYYVCDEYAEMQRFLDQHKTLKAQLEGVLMRMKIDAYRWNDDRLDESLREAFWERAGKELTSDWNQGYFKKADIDPRTETDLLLIMRSPREYIERRKDFEKPGKLNTFKHYYRIGGIGLALRVMRYQLTHHD